MEANNQDSGAAAKSSSLLSSFRSSSSYNHETETIFALPRMQLDFKSIHVQDPDEPSLTGGAGKFFTVTVLRVSNVLFLQQKTFSVVQSGLKGPFGVFNHW